MDLPCRIYSLVSNLIRKSFKMPVILFIIDNSASMNQTTYLGTSYLDLAKSAVENFLKIRSRDQLNARNDRYMLLTLEEPPLNIKVGWKEHMSIFTSALKNLRAMGLTNINPVLKQAFDLLNLNRLSSGMDTFGQVIFFNHLHVHTSYRCCYTNEFAFYFRVAVHSIWNHR